MPGGSQHGERVADIEPNLRDFGVGCVQRFYVDLVVGDAVVFADELLPQNFPDSHVIVHEGIFVADVDHDSRVLFAPLPEQAYPCQQGVKPPFEPLHLFVGPSEFPGDPQSVRQRVGRCRGFLQGGIQCVVCLRIALFLGRFVPRIPAVASCHTESCAKGSPAVGAAMAEVPACSSACMRQLSAAAGCWAFPGRLHPRASNKPQRIGFTGVGRFISFRGRTGRSRTPCGRKCGAGRCLPRSRCSAPGCGTGR